MKILDRLYEINPLKMYRIKTILERECEKLLESAFELNDRFTRNFYSYIVSCGKTDAYDLASELTHNHLLDISGGGDASEFYKWLCIYNVVRFCCGTADDRSVSAKAHIGGIFKLNAADLGSLHHFEKLCAENVSAFEAEYADFLLGVFCRKPAADERIKQFITNFITDSYSCFIKSFTSYSPVDSALYTG